MDDPATETAKAVQEVAKVGTSVPGETKLTK